MRDAERRPGRAPATDGGDAPPSPEIASLVEALVRAAAPAGARERDELRRELLAHFVDAAGAGDATALEGSPLAAIARFGSAESVGGALRQVYRPGRHLAYAAKVAASLAIAAVLALGLELVPNLRLASRGGGLALSPWYGPTARVALIVALAAVVAWEAGIEPLCTRLERHPARLLGAFLALLAAVVAMHTHMDVPLEPGDAALRAAVTIAVWVSTIALASRLEWAFLRFFGRAA